MRKDADIPRVQWTGLNAAWPAIQGFRMDRAPCKNKVCPGKVPHGAGVTLCYICTTFKTTKGRLPTNAEISQLMSKGQKLEAARAKAGPDPACGDCGRKESFIAVKHLVHHLAPGVLLCGACVMQLKAHGVMHTAEEKAKLVGVSALISRRRTEEVLCDNCAVPESFQLTRQHIYNAEVGQVLCSACDSYRRMFGRDRDPAYEIRLTRRLVRHSRTGTNSGKRGCQCIASSAMLLKLKTNMNTTTIAIPVRYCAKLAIYIFASTRSTKIQLQRYADRS
ncbi:hypothetical protein VE04_08809 [Pseudogymnoascus sp. 24MN13]|nr:hypothetical protein VE04_08809 [Pseudogymnoascus sp. 24MN13]